MVGKNAGNKRKSTAAESAVELIDFAHDLRQYVSAGLLLSKMPGDESLEPELRKRLQLIHQQFLHAADLIATAGSEFTPRQWQLNLAPLVEECVRLVQLNHGVSIHVEGGTRPVAYGDPVLIRRALVNVLDNASRAVAESGNVTVTLGEDDETAWIEVVDSGRGFGQIQPGTGHGLSIVHAAMQASNGRLEISSGPGPGTKVRMVLPTRLAGEQAS